MIQLFRCFRIILQTYNKYDDNNTNVNYNSYGDTFVNLNYL